MENPVTTKTLRTPNLRTPSQKRSERRDTSTQATSYLSPDTLVMGEQRTPSQVLLGALSVFVVSARAFLNQELDPYQHPVL